MRRLEGALGWARVIGPEGLLMLGCSLLLIGLTGGVSLIVAGRRVLLTASGAPTAPPEPVPIAVVHGKAPRLGAIDADYTARLGRARALLAAGLVERVVIVGGSRDRAAPVSEAELGRRFLVEGGVPQGRILIEPTSRHTLENIRHLRALVGHEAHRGLVLVSSRYHLARCRAMASGCGLAVTLCAAEPRLAIGPRFALRLASEAFLLHWYEVGRSLSRALRYQRALARIS